VCVCVCVCVCVWCVCVCMCVCVCVQEARQMHAYNMTRVYMYIFQRHDLLVPVPVA